MRIVSTQIFPNGTYRLWGSRHKDVSGFIGAILHGVLPKQSLGSKTTTILPGWDKCSITQPILTMMYLVGAALLLRIASTTCSTAPPLSLIDTYALKSIGTGILVL